MIDERLDPLVRERRAHDRLEERAILDVEEQVQLVTGVLAVALVALGVGQRRPARHERELAEGRVVAQGKQIGVGALHRVDQMELRGREILDHDRLRRRAAPR